LTWNDSLIRSPVAVAHPESLICDEQTDRMTDRAVERTGLV